MKKASKLLRIVLPTVCALLFGVLLVLGVASVRYQVWGRLEEPVTGLPEIVSQKPLNMDGMAIEEKDGEGNVQYAVSQLEGCYDKNDSLVAYKMTMTTVGYNKETPISMAVVISADGTVVRNISILSQKESQYYGDNIKYPDFAQRFENRYLPLFFTGEHGRGAHVDGVSNATVTSKAVVGAINWAQEFVCEYFVEGE